MTRRRPQSRRPGRRWPSPWSAIAALSPSPLAPLWPSGAGTPTATDRRAPPRRVRCAPSVGSRSERACRSVGCLPTYAGFCPATPNASPPCEGGAGIGEGRGAGGLKGGRGGEKEGFTGHFVSTSTSANLASDWKRANLIPLFPRPGQRFCRILGRAHPPQPCGAEFSSGVLQRCMSISLPPSPIPSRGARPWLF